MNIAIIEDETSVAQNLSDLLYEINPEIKVLVVLETIRDSIKWFQKNNTLDLAFFDIKIADGQSFEILEKIQPSCPIIFTTAYDEYALQAFKYNSIDYLLKPINKNDLQRSIVKYQNLYSKDNVISENNAKLMEVIQKIKSSNQRKIYKKSLLVHYQNQLIPIAITDIAYFYLENQLICCVTKNNETYRISSTLEKIQHQIDPNLFFRVNRQYIISKKAVISVIQIEHRKLKLNISPKHPNEIIIGKLKAANFKRWLNEL